MAAATAVVFGTGLMSQAVADPASTGPGGQPVDDKGNPIAVPAPQPTFPRAQPAVDSLPTGWKHSQGRSLEELTQQAEKSQGKDASARGKPKKGSKGEGKPRQPGPKKPRPDKSSGRSSGGSPQVDMASAMLTQAEDSHDAHGHHSTMQAAGIAAADLAPPAVQGPTGLPESSSGKWTLGPVLPSASIHSVVLNTGKILIIAGSENEWETFASGTFTSLLWDPSTGVMKELATPHDMFCNGHVVLRDGRVLVAGGTTGYPAYDSAGNLVRDWRGSKQSYIFDPISEVYEPTDDMNVGRWYPTLVRMGNDQVVAVAGLDEGTETTGGVDTPVNEIFTPSPASTWDNFAGGAWDVLNTRAWPQYAHMVLTDDGELFYTGQSTANNGQSPGLWEPYSNTFTEVPGLPHRWQRNAGASILLPPAQDQKVMVMGGGDWQLQSLNDTHIVDLSSPDPAYVEGPPMANPKMYVGAVTLPDYTVLQTNGARRFREEAVRDAEIYDPSTDAWYTMNSPTIDRLYHSTAFLLPDGRVATLGSQVIEGQNEKRIEIFEPPYLHNGVRPTIDSGPTWIDYDAANAFSYEVTTEAGAGISKVSLLRPSATTHSTDTEQRLVDLPFTHDAGKVSFTVPANRNLLPPGWYMLTVLDDAGRPSVAKWVSLN